MRSHFRRRRRYSSYGERKLSPWIIVAICVASALIITIFIGNLLKLWLDDDAYRALTEGTTAPPAEEEAPPPTYKTVRANAFVLGENTDHLWEDPEVSILINTPDGTVQYSSAVASHFGIPMLDTVTIEKGFEDLNAAASHVSGVFYPRAYAYDNADLRYAETAKEASLLHEFLEAGGNEIVLCGLPWDSETVERDVLLQYVRDLRVILGDTPIGVAIPLAIANDGTNWRLLTKIDEAASFSLLDLREADGSRTPTEWLADYNYFRTQYDMRLLLGTDQSDLIDEARNLQNVQTVTAIHTSSTPSS